jgi:glycosyltransferase involved in cell wall biosynthesis
MKILMVVDKIGSAISRLSDGVKKYNPHLHIDIIAVHPKRPDIDQLEQFERLAKKADILDFEYWKTYVTLKEIYPELMNKPKMLAHYNPYNIFEENWDKLDLVTVCNIDMASRMKKAKYIPLTVDAEKFPFNNNYNDSKTVLMVSSRIESKKGVLPVAQVCAKLGYKLLLVGSVSKADYSKEVMNTGCVEFRERVTDEELLKAYQESAVHVCNSIDDYESGTMPILEAMLVGCPVLTRNIGHVPELNNGKNMVVRQGQPDDLEDLETELKNLMDNIEKRKSIREHGWNSAKVRDDVRRARMYNKLWHSILNKEPVVSVIIPTFNRVDTLVKVLESIIIQDYPAMEVVVCNDGSTDLTEKTIQMIRNTTTFPIKIVNTNTPDEYNLSLARNLGVIEAIGEILVFLDDRYYLDDKCISEFVKKLFPKKWLFGNKGKDKKSFVENFSCIYRDEFITAGMFNQSCKLYGFLTQETRERFRRQDFKFEYVPEAKCEIILNSKAKYHKRDEIRQAKNILFKMDL